MKTLFHYNYKNHFIRTQFYLDVKLSIVGVKIKALIYRHTKAFSDPKTQCTST